IRDAVEHAIGDIADMNIVPLEVLFKNNNVAFDVSRVDEMINQQVQPHAGRHAKYGGQPQRNDIGAAKQVELGLDLGLAIERDGRQRTVLGTEAGSTR